MPDCTIHSVCNCLHIMLTCSINRQFTLGEKWLLIGRSLIFLEYFAVMSDSPTAAIFFSSISISNAYHPLAFLLLSLAVQVKSLAAHVRIEWTCSISLKRKLFPSGSLGISCGVWQCRHECQHMF